MDDEVNIYSFAKYRLERAKEDLSDAQYSYKDRRYLSANNRAYYAVFRAMLACLALEFKAYRQHAQVIGNFNKDFVHSGDFPKEISRKISRVQEVRHASDYDDFYIVSVDDAKEQVETAKEVVEMVDKYLQEKVICDLKADAEVTDSEL